jgi:CRP/FNR family transcriptional regulator, cyclic AMP receptor protein
MRDDTNFLGMFNRETKTRTVPAGTLLFAKGDPGHEMFIVKSGQMQVFDGNIVFETLGPGGIVGEMALVDQSPRSLAVKAMTDCEVIPVDEKRFLWMVEQTPFFAVRMLKVMAARLRKTNDLVKAIQD